MVIDPESGASAPARIAISVLLPAPFCPTSPQISPAATDSATPSSATVAPNALRMPCIPNRSLPSVIPAAMGPALRSCSEKEEPVLRSFSEGGSLLEVRLQQRLDFRRVHVVFG